MLETDPAKVLRHYFCTWGCFDIAGSMPLTLLLSLCGAPPDGIALCLTRLLKLQRVAKLIAVMQVCAAPSVVS
jgi:hypothetical protein